MTDLYPLVHAEPQPGSKTLPCCGSFPWDLMYEEHGDSTTTDPDAVTCRPATHHRNGERYSFTQAELWEMATERFGKDYLAWAFVCGACGDVATPADFLALGAEIGRCGQECVGRIGKTTEGTDPQGRPWNSRGCNSTTWGLFPGPWKITGTNEHGEPTVWRSFRLAPAPLSGDTNSPE